MFLSKRWQYKGQVVQTSPRIFLCNHLLYHVTAENVCYIWVCETLLKPLWMNDFSACESRHFNDKFLMQTATLHTIAPYEIWGFLESWRLKYQMSLLFSWEDLVVHGGPTGRPLGPPPLRLLACFFLCESHSKPFSSLCLHLWQDRMCERGSPEITGGEGPSEELWLHGPQMHWFCVKVGFSAWYFKFWVGLLYQWCNSVLCDYNKYEWNLKCSLLNSLYSIMLQISLRIESSSDRLKT